MGIVNQRFADLVAAQWRSGGAPPNIAKLLAQRQDVGDEELFHALRIDMEQRWLTASPWRVEDYRRYIPKLQSQRDIIRLIEIEFSVRRALGTSPPVQEYLQRFPDLAESLRHRLSLDFLDVTQAAATSQPAPPTTARSDSTATVEGSLDHRSDHEASCQPTATGPGADATETCRSTFVPTSQAHDLPKSFGRYCVEKMLGAGAFGAVYLGYDAELERHVAIKVPRSTHFRSAEHAEAYLEEARHVAGLDHPNIVPVHDVGRTAGGTVFVVSKYIEGETLADRLERGNVSCQEAVQWIAAIADALAHAHRRKLIHRDIKPANILLESSTGTACLADFGLALQTEEQIEAGIIAGTPSYGCSARCFHLREAISKDAASPARRSAT